MIRHMIDRLAYWWLDHRTQPTDPTPGVEFRCIGGPLDGTTATDRTGTPTRRVIHIDPDGRRHVYRNDGHDPDGVLRLCYDPQEGQ